MFIAMNRFRIAPGFEEGFEDVWRSRESYLDQIDGFREFKLLRGPSDDEATLYASHVVWDSREHFDVWRQSDEFKKAHGQTNAPPGTYLEHPRFEGFDVVL